MGKQCACADCRGGAPNAGRLYIRRFHSSLLTNRTGRTRELAHPTWAMLGPSSQLGACLVTVGTGSDIDPTYRVAAGVPTLLPPGVLRLDPLHIPDAAASPTYDPTLEVLLTKERPPPAPRAPLVVPTAAPDEPPSKWSYTSGGVEALTRRFLLPAYGRREGRLTLRAVTTAVSWQIRGVVLIDPATPTVQEYALYPTPGDESATAVVSVAAGDVDSATLDGEHWEWFAVYLATGAVATGQLSGFLRDGALP